eukprot:gene24492-5104_t
MPPQQRAPSQTTFSGTVTATIQPSFPPPSSTVDSADDIPYWGTKEDQAAADRGEPIFYGSLTGKRRYPTQWIYGGTAAVLYGLYDVASKLSSGQIALEGCFWLWLGNYFLVDLLSGFFHLILDNPYFAQDSDNAILEVIKPLSRGFQEHHKIPTVVSRVSVFEHCLPMAIPATIHFLVGQLHRHPYVTFHSLCITGWLMCMQMGHRWAHMQRKNRPIGISQLQDWGFLIPPSEHMKHHKSPHEEQFCIMSGVMNPFLNWLTIGSKIKAFHPRNPAWAFYFLGLSFLPHVFFVAHSLIV